MCKSIQGGTWHTITMEKMPAFAQGLPGMNIASNLNRFENPAEKKSRMVDLTSDAPFPNIHGDKPFLVKFQTMLGANSHMMMYDRQRSFQTFFNQRSDPAVFRDFLSEAQGPRGGYEGLKACTSAYIFMTCSADGSQMYRYVKRVDDTSLSVCLDRQPRDNILW
jgi:hypothetical protein